MNAQDIAVIEIEGARYPVLRRMERYGVALKLARGWPTTGRTVFLEAESQYLAEYPQEAERLIKGEVVHL